MNSKTGQNREKETIVEDESIGVEELTEEDINLDPSYTLKVYEFLQKSKVDIQPKYYLYKYDNYDQGESKALIDKFLEGDPPDEHDIGLRFGSGRWLLIMVIPPHGNNKKGNMRAYRFRTHPHYDSLKTMVPEALPPGAGPIAHYGYRGPGGNNGLTEALGVLERLLCSIVPLFKPNENPDMSAMMLNNYNMMSGILKRQMSENMQLIGDMQRAIAEGGTNQVQTETDDQPGVVEQLAPYIADWLPLLLGGGQKAAAVSNVVKATPTFKNIIQDKVQLRKLLKYLDETQGKDKTDKILQQLKVKRI